MRNTNLTPAALTFVEGLRLEAFTVSYREVHLKAIDTAAADLVAAKAATYKSPKAYKCFVGLAIDRLDSAVSQAMYSVRNAGLRDDVHLAAIESHGLTRMASDTTLGFFQVLEDLAPDYTFDHLTDLPQATIERIM